VVEPSIANSVANRASFTFDFRHPDKDVLLAGGDAVAGVVLAAVVGGGDVPRSAGGIRALVIDAAERAAAEQQYWHMRPPSGPCHDAQFAVPVCPTAMISSRAGNGSATIRRSIPNPRGGRQERECSRGH
jgi:N-carbamoyl-L-amino-acid hydrolase